MSALGISIAGVPFSHLIYHFILPYSNWETGTICFSESFESLSTGLQNALFELGGVPVEHRTDRLSTAIHKNGHKEEFTRRYKALLAHYNITGKKIQTGKPNENGDIKQSRHRFKRAVDQALVLRESRDFSSRNECKAFLKKIFCELNANRKARFTEELKSLRRLPNRRLDTSEKISVKVGSSSTIRVRHNTYSVISRLIGQTVNVFIHAAHIEIFYAQKKVEKIPRIKDEGKYFINYRHIIDWLIRKPGAFANYRYQSDLFPTTRFRVAYDVLKTKQSLHADKEYLGILYLAAYEGQSKVDSALKTLIDSDLPITRSSVSEIITEEAPAAPKDVKIADIDLKSYDRLLTKAVIV